MSEESTMNEENPLVIIIEDDADVRNALADGLSMLGFRTLEACDGKSGVEAAWREQPDAVLMDVCMPGMDGWQTTALIREYPGLQSVPIIFVSGSSEARTRYFNSPPFNSSFVPKPFSMRFLDTLLRAFIRLRSGTGGDGLALPKAWEGKTGSSREWGRRDGLN